MYMFAHSPVHGHARESVQNETPKACQDSNAPKDPRCAVSDDPKL